MDWKREDWILLAIPSFLLVLSVLLVEAHGPYHLAANFDPEYCYLFNSLNLLAFHPPTHTDHPGTTLQVLGAVVMLGRWAIDGIVSGWQPLAEAVLSEPEDYLYSINLTLNLLYCGLLLIVARRVYRVTGSLAPALALQASFLIFREAFLAQTRVSPEPLLLSAALVLIWTLVPVVMGENRSRQASSPKVAILAGVAFAFGVVTKVTFLPLGFMVLLFPGLRPKARFAGAAAVCTAVLLTPIAARIPRLAGWVWSMLIHQERYGQGEVGLPNVADAVSRLGEMFRVEPFFYLFVGLYMVLFAGTWIWQSNGDRTGETRRLLGGSVLAISILVLFTMKHFALHYPLPAMALVPFANASLVERFRLGFPRRAVWTGIGLLLLIGGLASTAKRMNDWRGFEAAHQESFRQQNQTMGQMKECAVAGLYRSSLLTHALNFGNRFSNLVQTSVLEGLYPGAMNYNLRTDQFESFGHRGLNDRVAAGLRQGRCILLQGESSKMEQISSFRYEPVSEPGWEQLVRITEELNSPPNNNEER